VGAGLDIKFLKVMTLHNNLQYTWIDIPNGYFKNPQRLDRSRLEVNPTLNIVFPICSAENRLIPYLTAFDEATYDVEHGIPIRNEVGVGLRLCMDNKYSLSCGWRHMDWVKDFDSDQVEVSVGMRF
ncbi:MAG: hypothetical protein ABH825_02760, partial [Candidatus Omnitrophota bacterium]